MKARATTLPPAHRHNSPPYTFLSPSKPPLPAPRYPRPSSPPTRALEAHGNLTKESKEENRQTTTIKPLLDTTNLVWKSTPTELPTSTTTTTDTARPSVKTSTVSSTTTSANPPSSSSKPEEGEGEASHSHNSYMAPPPLYPRPSLPPPSAGDPLPHMEDQPLATPLERFSWEPLPSLSSPDEDAPLPRMDHQPLAPPLTFYEEPGPTVVRVAKDSYGAPKASPSSSYGPPSYSPPKAQPSYSPPKAQPSYSPPKAQPSYSPPKAQPSYSPPAAALPSYAPPSYSPPKAALPSYSATGAAQPAYGGFNPNIIIHSMMRPPNRKTLG